MGFRTQPGTQKEDSGVTFNPVDRGIFKLKKNIRRTSPRIALPAPRFVGPFYFRLFTHEGAVYALAKRRGAGGGSGAAS